MKTTLLQYQQWFINYFLWNLVERRWKSNAVRHQHTASSTKWGNLVFHIAIKALVFENEISENLWRLQLYLNFVSEGSRAVPRNQTFGLHIQFTIDLLYRHITCQSVFVFYISIHFRSTGLGGGGWYSCHLETYNEVVPTRIETGWWVCSIVSLPSCIVVHSTFDNKQKKS